MFDSCLTRLRNLHITEALQPYLRSTNSEIQLTTLAALAGIIDEKESEMINSNEESVLNLMKKLRNGLKTKLRQSAGWNCYECARSRFHVVCKNT